MKVVDIIEVIEKTAPLHYAASWDASGVQIASFAERATHIGVMLDPTEESIRAALDAGADFLLAHHPFSMQAKFPNKADGYLRVLSTVLKREAWLYSAHTSLDANPRGPVRWLADALGLRDIHTLEADAPKGCAPLGGVPGKASGEAHEDGSYAIGFGFVGQLPQALDYASFKSALALALGRQSWHVCGPEPQSVRTVACCPGSGSSLFSAALALGADVFITGDVKYHAALDICPLPLRVIDVGHFILEEIMMRTFAKELAGALRIPVTFIPGRDPLAGECAETPDNR